MTTKRIPNAVWFVISVVVPIAAIYSSVVGGVLYVVACSSSSTVDPGLLPVDSDTFTVGHATIKFDRRTRVPKWSLEVLTAAEVSGDTERSDVFLSPDFVPEEFRPSVRDYSLSGFDRGHAVPCADFADQQAANDSFTLANVFPQDRKLNRGMWAELEQQIRSLASRDGVTVYVLTVPMWMPDNWPLTVDITPNVVTYAVIGRNHVAVPTHIGKSLLVFDGENYSARSYCIPNKKPATGFALDNYRVTADWLEHWSGIDMWSGLADELEVRIERAN